MTIQILLGSGLNATLSASSVSGEVFLNEPAPVNVPVTSNPVSVLVSSGGTGYSYEWEHVSGSVVTVNASGNSATFTSTVGKNNSVTASYRCKVTVAPGVSIYTPNLTITLSYFTDL